MGGCMRLRRRSVSERPARLSVVYSAPCGKVTKLKMSPYHTFRSFATYLAFAIIFESPVSAFTIQRTRTTTLKPTFDITAEESALLEVRNDLPKINNAKVVGHAKETPIFPKDAINIQIASEDQTRTSANSLVVEKKSTEMTVQTQSLSLNETTQPVMKVSNDIETTVDLATDKIQSTSSYEKNISETSDVTTISEVDISTPEKTTTNIGPSDNKVLSSDIPTEQNNIVSTQITEVTSEVNNEVNSESLTTSITEVPLSTTTETTLQSLKILGINTNTNEPLTVTEMPISEKESTVGVETNNGVTGDKTQSETMTAEATSAVTRNPIRKTYTTIDRKRATSSEIDIPSTEQSESVTKVETVPAKITLENSVNDTPIPSLNELRKELITNSKTYNSRNSLEVSTSLHTDQTTVALPASIYELSPISNSHTGPDNIVTSKRAGFLDFTVKQTDPDDTATGDGLNFNETELVGAMFEVDLQDNDSLEVKNGSESQSQLVEDAIKEKLLEEQVLNDELVKNYQKHTGLTVPSEIKSESITEDSLSVKPISPKSGLYTVSPNYKKMKKIEVQPLKPFIRDPDDNSWRNESLSLLGIVFKAKNASKPFTQVLKNKTEAELSNISEKDEKNEVSDLRERLEKIAEVRKSRKKKINKAGETVYGDYEENISSEINTTPKTETTLPLFDADGKLAFVGKTTPLNPLVAPELTTTPGVYMYKEDPLTTKKPKKINKFAEYYDTTDEYDADYITLPKIDLKKFTTSFYNKDTPTTPPMLLTTHAKSLNNQWPDRKPTIQYFPPRPQQPKIDSNDYNVPYEKNVNFFSINEAPKDVTHVSAGTMPTPHQYALKPQPQQHGSTAPTNKPANLYKNFYATIPSRVAEPGNQYSVSNDETFNRASYVIKHFKDLIDEAVKDNYDKNGEYVQPYTDSPLTGVTMNDMVKNKLKSSMDDDYDYASNFRKDILNKFVDNFNQNSERFKVDFPILYNSSIVHRKTEDNGRVVASSTAFLKRQYGDLAVGKKPCEPNCELKVELSPAYELHYYVPDQEEKEEVEPKLPTLPYTYRL